MSDKIKILYLAANPTDTSRLRLMEEARELQERIRSGAHGRAFKVVHYLAVQPRDLLRGLQEEQPHILHFSGHANYDKQILFQNDQGTSQPISPKDLVDLIKVFPGNLKLALLMLCFGRKHASALVQVIDFAIGMTKPILDKGAVSFSAAFYQALAGGSSVQQAFDGARAVMGMEGRTVFTSSDLLVRPGVNADEPFIKELASEQSAVKEPGETTMVATPSQTQSPAKRLDLDVRDLKARNMTLENNGGMSETSAETNATFDSVELREDFNLINK
jgi:hypothetical protein